MAQKLQFHIYMKDQTQGLKKEHGRHLAWIIHESRLL